MTSLKPVDFKAVAAKGAFVYCYLRADGTPYYVGFASTATRPFGKHECAVPRKNRERVRVLRSGLSNFDGFKWEMFFIARYGRKDIGTGILRNQTAGGEGFPELSPEAVARRDAHCKGNQYTKGRKMPANEKLIRSLANKGNDNSKATAAMIASENRLAAKKYGCTLEFWVGLTKSERAAVYTRFVRGVRGKGLFAFCDDKERCQRAADTKKAKTAARMGIPAKVFIDGSSKLHARLRYYFKNGAGLTGSELLVAAAA